LNSLRESAFFGDLLESVKVRRGLLTFTSLATGVGYLIHAGGWYFPCANFSGQMATFFFSPIHWP
jgi:hypothetical protein